MPTPARPRDPIARAKVVMDMLIGETPNDKDQVLGTAPEPGRHAKAAKARAAGQTPDRRREVARNAAAARWRKA